MQIKINKRSAYAPIRYEATRPYAVALGKAYSAESAKGEAARIQFLNGRLLQLLKAGVSKMGHEKGPGPLQAEIVNVQVAERHCTCVNTPLNLRKLRSRSSLGWTRRVGYDDQRLLSARS